jgi:hypothetical protein
MKVRSILMNGKYLKGVGSVKEIMFFNPNVYLPSVGKICNGPPYP